MSQRPPLTSAGESGEDDAVPNFQIVMTEGTTVEQRQRLEGSAIVYFTQDEPRTSEGDEQRVAGERVHTCLAEDQTEAREKAIEALGEDPGEALVVEAFDPLPVDNPGDPLPVDNPGGLDVGDEGLGAKQD